MNINDNLIQLAETKSLIKDAIISKGGSVDDTTPFRDYAQAVTDLPSGGSSAPTINKVLGGDVLYLNSDGTLVGTTSTNVTTEDKIARLAIPTSFTLYDDRTFVLFIRTPSNVRNLSYEHVILHRLREYNIGLTSNGYFQDYNWNTGVNNVGTYQVEPNTEYKITIKLNTNKTITFNCYTMNGTNIYTFTSDFWQTGPNPAVIGIASDSYSYPFVGEILLGKSYAIDSDNNVIWRPFGDNIQVTSYRLPTVEEDGYACEIRGDVVNMDNTALVVPTKVNSPSTDTGAFIEFPTPLELTSGDSYDICFDFVSQLIDNNDCAYMGLRSEDSNDSHFWIDSYNKLFRISHYYSGGYQEFRLGTDNITLGKRVSFKINVTGTALKFFYKRTTDADYIQFGGNQTITRGDLFTFKDIVFGKPSTTATYTKQGVYYLPNCYIAKNGEVLYRTVIHN